jgi:hypothetical protein
MSKNSFTHLSKPGVHKLLQNLGDKSRNEWSFTSTPSIHLHDVDRATAVTLTVCSSFNRFPNDISRLLGSSTARCLGRLTTTTTTFRNPPLSLQSSSIEIITVDLKEGADEYFLKVVVASQHKPHAATKPKSQEIQVQVT